MPVTMELREHGHVIYFTIADPWSVNDLTACFPDDQRCRDSVKYKIHTLVNASSAKIVPPFLLIARNAPSLVHPNHGFVVAVGTTLILQSVGEIIFRLTNFTQGRFYTTEEEAWAFLHQIIVEESGKDFPTP